MRRKLVFPHTAIIHTNGRGHPLPFFYLQPEPLRAGFPSEKPPISLPFFNFI